MARGRPALWSTILGLPFIAAGTYMYLRGPDLLRSLGVSESMLRNPENLRLLGGLPLLGFGVFVVLIGLYVQIIQPPEPSLHENEELIDTRYPSQRVAITKIILCVPFFVIAGYLLFFTVVPYVYPMVAFLVGLYSFSTGLRTYWANTLTTYHVTSERVISEFRFLSLRRKELPLAKLRAVEERKSILETFVGLGNIRVASGGGGGSVVLVAQNIGDSTSFANEIRDLAR